MSAPNPSYNVYFVLFELPLPAPEVAQWATKYDLGEGGNTYCFYMEANGDQDALIKSRNKLAKQGLPDVPISRCEVLRGDHFQDIMKGDN